MPPRKRTTRDRVSELLSRGVTDHREMAQLLGIHPEYARQVMRDPSEAAAIDRYSKRRVLPPDPVRCGICGALLTVIGTHLRVHGIDLATYKRQYPGAPTVSPSFRRGGVDIYADRLVLSPEDAQYWTRERIVQAIREWAKRTGKPPGARQWRKPISCKGWKIGDPVQHHRPSMARVIQVFGSWSAAIAAAGFKPRPGGYQRDIDYRPRPRPTHCKRGHPLRGKNLYIRKEGYYQCRTCHRERQLRRYHERKGYRPGGASASRGRLYG